MNHFVIKRFVWKLFFYLFALLKLCGEILLKWSLWINAQPCLKSHNVENYLHFNSPLFSVSFIIDLSLVLMIDVNLFIFKSNDREKKLFYYFSFHFCSSEILEMLKLFSASQTFFHSFNIFYFILFINLAQTNETENVDRKMLRNVKNVPSCRWSYGLQ